MANPTGNAPDSPDVKRDISALRDAFEQAWHAGQKPRIEDYLTGASEETRSIALRELIAEELNLLRSAGETRGVEEYKNRFPDNTPDIDAAFNLSGRGEKVTPPIDDTQSMGPHSLSDTKLVAGTSAHAAANTSEGIGRFKVEKLLGEGSFGAVYLAHDPDLDRFVALKVPRAGRFGSDKEREQFVSEAKTAAKLEHPGIVTVHDVFQDGDQVVIVQRYIEGQDLGARLNSGEVKPKEAAKMMATIAEAVAFAHSKSLVHRDLKPGNILLDSQEQPYVADFGLAIREEDYVTDGRIAGTPAYMSPEQVRGEGHRLDGRSDVFSLGVIFYEMLTTKRPFRGSTTNELLHQVVSVDPPHPGELDDSIPAELERICLKALSKRASGRYSTAAELAHDLTHWDQTPERPTREVQVIPKGLRSFDVEDADFFLDLLPGPRDREGMPEIIRFWKTRIEQTDPDKTFSVGLIYGPSGCGKSSLVRAGLLPRLSSDVTSVYVEATPDETETRILRALRKQLPELPDDLGLIETFTLLRRAEGQKVLVVVDQYEQWLHAHRGDRESELVDALRQCDGSMLQAVVMLRDDFAMAAARFMDSLDIPILQGNNFATVDLFDVDHAERVLSKFGQAFGKLPAQTDGLSDEEREFVGTATSGLAQDGKVVSVRLSLFAEMVKGKAWIPATLEEVGGTEGIGVSFLEETFSSRSANPKHRLHQQAARKALKALLPEVGSDIKGHMRSHAELLEACGYANRPADFNDLLRILDGELRLITPTDPEGFQTESGIDSGVEHYQLTHDYLVPSLREWLTRKQKETRRGRAELRLADRSALWNAKPENRHLPSVWEYVGIRALTAKKNWLPPQWKMMAKAGRVHGVRCTIATVLLVAATAAGVSTWDYVEERQASTQAAERVDALMKADIGNVPDALKQLEPLRTWADPLLGAHYDNAADLSPEKVRAALGLLPTDSQKADYLVEHLLQAQAAEVPVLVTQLGGQGQQLGDQMWEVTTESGEDARKRRLRAACALAAFDPDNAQWTDICEAVVDQLVRSRTVDLAYWQAALRPVASHLAEPLSRASYDTQLGPTERNMATDLTVDYAADMPEVLADAIQYADEQQFPLFFSQLQRHARDAAEELIPLLMEEPRFDWRDQPLDATWKSPEQELVQRLEAAGGTVDDRFAFCQTLAVADFQNVCGRLRPSGFRPRRVRPYADGDKVLVAAVFARDGCDWQWEIGDAEQIRSLDEQHRQGGFHAVDVASFRKPDDQDDLAPQFAALWTEAGDTDTPNRLLVGVGDEELKAALSSLEQDGFKRRLSYVVTPLDGGRRLTSVVMAEGDATQQRYAQAGTGYTGDLHLGLLQADVHVAHGSRPATAEERYSRQLEDAEKKLAESPDDVQVRFDRAVAHYYLDQLDEAAEDLTWLLQKEPDANVFHKYQALVLARQGNAEEAQAALAKWLESEDDDAQKVYVETVVGCYLGKSEEVLPRLDAQITDHIQDGEFLYGAARAYSIAHKVAASEQQEQAQTLQQRALTLLKEACEQGFSELAQMQSETDLEPLRGLPAFDELLQPGKLDQYITALWEARADAESVELHGLGPAEHLARSQELVEQGYRPVCMSATAGTDDLVTASVWHRPLVPETEKELLAKRQANAAVALVKLGQTDEVWPSLKHRPDPRGRSYLIHRLASLGTDPSALVAKVVDEAEDISVRRALLLCLGQFDSQQLPDDGRQALVPKLLDLYRTHPDAGLHAAAEWLLRQWGQGDLLVEVRKSLQETEPQLVERKSDDARQWYVTGQGHTMVVIHGGSFLMGSPGSDPDRDTDEMSHRKRIDRRFALSATAVTRGQYRVFQEESEDDAMDLMNNREVADVVRTDDSPITAMTWYEAVAYCNWLSEKEGIPEDQWCYARNSEGKYGPGMRPNAGYLLLRGYRLPSEAEWEYACRAGAVTRRYYGHSDELLAQYAWFEDNCDKRTWPVGLKKPNDFGLFDMHANVWAWCHNRNVSYGETETDEPETQSVQDTQSRVLRGGSIFYYARDVRSAFRASLRPNYRLNDNGFRLARTYP